MKYALIVHTSGLFEVREMDQFGNQRAISANTDLQLCLQHASTSIGHELVLPIETATSS